MYIPKFIDRLIEEYKLTHDEIAIDIRNEFNSMSEGNMDEDVLKQAVLNFLQDKRDKILCAPAESINLEDSRGDTVLGIYVQNINPLLHTRFREAYQKQKFIRKENPSSIDSKEDLLSSFSDFMEHYVLGGMIDILEQMQADEIDAIIERKANEE